MPKILVSTATSTQADSDVDSHLVVMKKLDEQIKEQVKSWAAESHAGKMKIRKRNQCTEVLKLRIRLAIPRIGSVDDLLRRRAQLLMPLG